MASIKLAATRDNLAKVFDFIQTHLSEYDIPKKIIRQIKLCVEEIYMNIVNYAYNPKTGETRLNLQITDENDFIKITIKFEDKGMPYDPTKKPDPNTKFTNIDDAPIGGLGIYLVKTTMDSIKYERKNDTNVLIIEKDVETETERK